MGMTAAIENLRQAESQLASQAPAPFHLPLGELEAVVAGAITGLDRGDWWVPGLRERVGAVLRDAPVEQLGNPLAGARPYRVGWPLRAPALRALEAVGLALAHPDRTVLVHLGLGSASDGAFHEALNLAALRSANVIFLVAVHPLEGNAPLGRQVASSPAAMAKALGVPAGVVDGASAIQVKKAVHAAKEGSGPHLIEARLRPGVDALDTARAEETQS